MGGRWIIVFCLVLTLTCIAIRAVDPESVELADVSDIEERSEVASALKRSMGRRKSKKSELGRRKSKKSEFGQRMSKKSEFGRRKSKKSEFGRRKSKKNAVESFE